MIYLGLFLLSLGLTYVVKNYAIKNALYAIPNDRSSHTVPTPHGGGTAIAITWFTGIIYLYLQEQIDTRLFITLLFGIVISVVSYIDDIKELPPKIRLMTQFGVAILGVTALGGLDEINLGWFTIDSFLICNLLAVVAIVWFINLYNFLDGIDGYAGSEALFLALAGLTLFGGSHFIVLSVAVLGFLVWNWHKAKIFMGDVGSTLLGYTVAIFTIYYANQSSNNLWIWIILFGLFWFDATLTLLRRYRNREKLSKAHKKHAYQRLTQSGWSHSKVVIASIVANSILFAIIYTISNLLIAFIISLILLYAITKFIDNQKAFK